MENPFKPGLIELPKIKDPRGNLSFAESGKLLPFEIERVYWTYDIPSWRERHGRALRTCAEVIIATSGQCSVTIDNGNGNCETFILNRSNVGLYIPPMKWRYITDFVTGTTCITISSKLFDETDYIRDYQQYLNALSDELR